MQITLAAARVNAGMTIAQAAKMLRLRAAHLAEYETGNAVPSISIIQRMEIVYGVRYDNIRFLTKNGELK